MGPKTLFELLRPLLGYIILSSILRLRWCSSETSKEGSHSTTHPTRRTIIADSTEPRSSSVVMVTVINSIIFKTGIIPPIITSALLLLLGHSDARLTPEYNQ